MEEPSIVPYCFQFTWLGPHSDHRSNGTCADLTQGASVPCVLPIKSKNNYPKVTFSIEIFFFYVR